MKRQKSRVPLQEGMVDGQQKSASFEGSGGNDVYTGTAGADTIRGYGGRDTLFGGGGADDIDGGEDGDFIYGDGAAFGDPDPDNLKGGGGDDVITAGYGDTVDGGDGTDELSLNFFGFGRGITLDLRDYSPGGIFSSSMITIANIERTRSYFLTDFDDILFAGIGTETNDNTIDGGKGNDQITGSASVERINGGDGDDIITGGLGRFNSSSFNMDIINGGAGNDLIYIQSDGAVAFGGTGDDQVFGGSGRDEIRGDDGNDRLDGGGDNDAVVGGAGDDIISGGDGDDFLMGQTGRDTLSGGAGNDSIFGGNNSQNEADVDQISGGDGNDSLYGSFGDFFDGGSGTDSLNLDFYNNPQPIVLDLRPLAFGGTANYYGGTITNMERVGTIVLSEGDDQVFGFGNTGNYIFNLARLRKVVACHRDRSAALSMPLSTMMSARSHAISLSRAPRVSHWIIPLNGWTIPIPKRSA